MCYKVSVPAPPQVHTECAAASACPVRRDAHARTAIPRTVRRGGAGLGSGAEPIGGGAGCSGAVRDPSGAVQLGHGGTGGSRFVPAAGGRSPGARSGFRGCGGAGGVGPRPGQPHRRAHRLQRRLRAAHGKGRAPPPRPRALAVSLFRILLAAAGGPRPRPSHPRPRMFPPGYPTQDLRDPPGPPAGPWGSEPDLLQPPLQTSSSLAFCGKCFLFPTTSPSG